MLLGLVMVITVVTYPQDTVTHKDSVTPPIPAPVPAPPPTPTIEQIHYLEGLKTVTRGVAQARDGVNRVVRTEKADSLTRRRAARRMGGLCGTARSFILSGRPRMQATAYADSMRILAKQVTMRLDSLSSALKVCEKTAGQDPNGVATTLTSRLKGYDDALLVFRTALKPDSTKAISQQQ
ncbi:MAG TPA: hypothetical protein VKC15_21670 [Gemmatimonadales bacterium]|nr:hypothetical protein [Gemmatimonadales bacterium]